MQLQCRIWNDVFLVVLGSSVRNADYLEVWTKIDDAENKLCANRSHKQMIGLDANVESKTKQMIRLFPSSIREVRC